MTSTGHAHPEVVAAIRRSRPAKLLPLLGERLLPADLLRRLRGARPDRAVVQAARGAFLTNSGTEAVEGAIKLARHATGRQYVIAMLELVPRPLVRQRLAHLEQGEVPHRVRAAAAGRAPHALRRLRAPGAGAVQAARLAAARSRRSSSSRSSARAATSCPPDGWFAYLRELCDRHGILLVADEVQSGMGRTGKWWAIEHFGVEPDIVLSGKGIASGMPLGAFIAREDLMSWESGAHGSTYGGNPVACAAALATIRLIEDGLMDNATRDGRAVRGRPERDRRPPPGDPRRPRQGPDDRRPVRRPRSHGRGRAGGVPAWAARARVRRRRDPDLAARS